jgi:hypothetical protein
MVPLVGVYNSGAAARSIPCNSQLICATVRNYGLLLLRYENAATGGLTTIYAIAIKFCLIYRHNKS